MYSAISSPRFLSNLARAASFWHHCSKYDLTFFKSSSDRGTVVLGIGSNLKFQTGSPNSEAQCTVRVQVGLWSVEFSVKKKSIPTLQVIIQIIRCSYQTTTSRQLCFSVFRTTRVSVV